MAYLSRFAPSPTGFLHIGNARSALINWAYIKNKGGNFILRIDDTDKNRSNIKYEDIIKENLNWLGIQWSKTFNQSQRIGLYKKVISRLIEEKKIYPCFETEEELSLKRKSLLSSGKPPIYDRSALNLTNEEIQKNIKDGKKPHWRFKLVDENIQWEDIIKGNISFDSKNISDPILIRENGSYLYHLPSVIDDIEEGITDIIRGEDHISNTAFHIQLFKSLNAKVPNFGHHSFLTDEIGKGFSKRSNSLSIQNLIDKGFEKATIINYLLSIGTSKNLSKEKNIEKIVNNFDIATLAVSSTKFSMNELEILNKAILKSYDYSDVKQKYIDLNYEGIDINFWEFIKNNINFFNESLEWINIIKSEEKIFNESSEFLKLSSKLLPNEPFDENTWNIWTNLIKVETGKSGKDLYMPIRLALTGKRHGPELKYLLPLLTKKQILKKLGNS